MKFEVLNIFLQFLRVGDVVRGESLILIVIAACAVGLLLVIAFFIIVLIVKKASKNKDQKTNR